MFLLNLRPECLVLLLVSGVPHFPGNDGTREQPGPLQTPSIPPRAIKIEIERPLRKMQKAEGKRILEKAQIPGR
jgi:hypothetical protein